MRKRISILTFIAALLLVINCALISVYADDSDWDNATDIVVEDLVNGVVFDKPYKMTPIEDVEIEISSEDKVVQVRENDGWSNVEAINKTVWKDGYNLTSYQLKAGNDYCFSKSSYSSSDNGLIKKVEYVTLTFDANEGSFTDEDTYQLQVVKDQRYDRRTFERIVPIREGYKFDSWNTKPDGTGFRITEYRYFSSDMTFYAIWRKYYKVSIYANGGYYRSGSVDPDINDYRKTDLLVFNIAERKPGSGANIDFGYIDGGENVCFWEPAEYGYTPRRDGFEIKCWNTKPDGSGKDYHASTPVTSEITVYTIWMCADDIHSYGKWVTIKKATETSGGLKTRTCKKCMETETQKIAKLKPSLPAVSIAKPKAAKKAAIIKWKKVSKANQKKIAKIQIQYSQDKTFKKNVKTTTAKKSATSKKITKLTKKKTYYVRVRAYKKDKKGVHISKWSTIKSVKVK